MSHIAPQPLSGGVPVFHSMRWQTWFRRCRSNETLFGGTFEKEEDDKNWLFSLAAISIFRVNGVPLFVWIPATNRRDWRERKRLHASSSQLVRRKVSRRRLE